MKRQLLHTPEGVRDIYSDECKKKQLLQEKLAKTIERYGYRGIETPTFEFFDIFGKEIGTTPSKDLYKFFDREGNTLVLRPDMTPSVARAVAMYFEPRPAFLYGQYLYQQFQLSGALKRNDAAWGGACRGQFAFCGCGNDFHGGGLPACGGLKGISD